MKSFFEIGAEERLKNNQLIELEKLIDWKRIEKLLKRVHIRDDRANQGGFSYNRVGMFKAVLLGQWHNLSDPKLEEALRVRLDFMIFTGFHLGDNIPDETTLCRFRNKLISNGLLTKLLGAINDELMLRGLMVKHVDGAVVDATVIESAARPRRTMDMSVDREEEEEVANMTEVVESCDKDAKWLKKGKKSYFGYKGYIATDNQDGYIKKVEVTPANSSEVGYFGGFIEGIEAKRILGDKGYASAKNRELLQDRRVKDGIMHKAVRNRPLARWQRLFNKLISRQRFIVEQAFGTLKRKFHMNRASYMGLRKVEGQLVIKAMCFNLLKALNMTTRMTNI